MRKLAAFLLFIVLMLTACRSEPERSALARTAESLDTGDNAALTRPEDGEAASRIEARRVRAGDYVDFYASAISPDGRYVTEIDWSTGDLAVRGLATDRLHRLTDKGPWEESTAYAANARFSPDGRRLAYLWYDEDTDDYEVRVLDFAVDDAGIPRGSNHRVAYAGGGPQPVSLVHDWISEDEILIEIYRPDNSDALAYLSLSTGTLRPLKSFAWGEGPDGVSVAPDGRFIAFGRSPDPESPDEDIYLLSADGRRETRLVEGPGVDLPLGWVPGDGSLLFHRWRSGNGSVWRLPMSDREPSGPPVLVRDNVRAPEPIGFADGAFYYGEAVDRPAIVTAPIDSEGRRLRRLPTGFEAPPGGRIRTFAWSPDGHHALLEIDDPRKSSTWVQLRTVDGELVGEWDFDVWIMFTVFQWAPDGNSVLVPARDDRERAGIIRLDLATGEPTMVRRFERGGEFGRVFAISPDGETLYYTHHEVIDGQMDESFANVVELDLATGAERSIERVRGHGGLTISPDGRWLALALDLRSGGPKMIRVLPIRGGDGHTVYTGDEQASRLPKLLGWSADSGSLLFLDRQPSDDGADVGLYRVSRGGGDAERIATLRAYKGGADLHPDGRTIAYRTGEPRGEIWALEGWGSLSSIAQHDTEESR